MHSPHPSPATDEFRSLLGDRAQNSEAVIHHYARTTWTTAAPPQGVLFPISTEEVVEIVRIARSHRVPLHPISRGRNWGYGDATPAGPGQWVVDLSRMNRILECDPKLGFVVVQPGVTQGQLQDFIDSNHLPLCIDSTGAGPEASLVGNAIDRGFGHTEYGDHFQTASGMEVVLGNGTVVQTGFSRFPGAASKWVYKYGAGPVLEGLFSQSNFGIVTRLCIWLMPKPESFSAFFFSSEKESGLEDAVNALAPLRLDGTLKSAIHIANDLRALSARTAPPPQMRVPLCADDRRKLRRKFGLEAWNGSASISGRKNFVRAGRKEVSKALRGFRLIWMDETRWKMLRWSSDQLKRWGLFPVLTGTVDLLEPVFQLAQGRPTASAVKGIGWRVPDQEIDPVDLLKSPAGLTWISPILPLSSDHCRKVLSILDPVFEKFQFDPFYTFTMINERSMVCVSNLAFDKRRPEDCSAAEACYSAAWDSLVRSGYYPYRMGPTGFRKLRQLEDPAFLKTYLEIKNQLDPDGVIAPGRYLG